MKRLAALIILAFFAIGTASSGAQSRIEKYASMKGWTLKQHQVFIAKDGSRRVDAEYIWHFNANGYLRKLSFLLGGEPIPLRRMIFTPDGNFWDDPNTQKRVYFGDGNAAHVCDMDVMQMQRSDPDTKDEYIRDEMVAGLKCAVTRSKCCDNNATREIYRAYNLCGFIIKEVFQYPDGTTNAIEPILFMPGSIASTLIDYHPEWPADFSEFEHTIERAEQRNEPSVSYLREMLANAKARLGPKP